MIAGYMELLADRKNRQSIHDLQLNALAAQGTDRSIKGQVSALRKLVDD